MNFTFDFILLGMVGPAQLALILVPILIMLGIGLLPLIFYLLTMQNTLKLISAESRKMEPGEVWLCIIPFFGIIWNFIVVSKMAESLQLEFEKKGIQEAEDKPGYSIGMAYCICYAAAIIPFLGYMAAVGGFVCWIIYWVKVDGFRKKLEGDWNKYTN
ncbi:hypothetical protein ACFLQX_00205 [Bacteroidota bacterium]